MLPYLNICLHAATKVLLIITLKIFTIIIFLKHLILLSLLTSFLAFSTLKPLLVKPFSTTAVLRGSANRNATWRRIFGHICLPPKYLFPHPFSMFDISHTASKFSKDKPCCNFCLWSHCSLGFHFSQRLWLLTFLSPRLPAILTLQYWPPWQMDFFGPFALSKKLATVKKRYQEPPGTSYAPTYDHLVATAVKPH